MGSETGEGPSRCSTSGSACWQQGPPAPMRHRRSTTACALFERLADALVTRAEGQGLVVLLDDLQWADAVSLLLLQHVVTHRRRARLMIAATIRSGEPTLGALGAALHHVGRTSSARRFDLAGFDRDDVAAQLAAFGHEPTADEVEAVAKHTGGNPLFVREMVRLVPPGEALTLDRVPDAVRVVLAQRIEPVSPTSRRTIAIASVVGTDIDVDLVRAIAGRSAEDVLDDLAEAERAGILNAHPRGTVPRFVHDLMREGLQDELSASERAAIHLAVAEELERRGGHEAAIAHHRLAALPVGDARSAIDAALAAARVAMTRLAFEDAAALFGRGLASSAASTLSPREQCAALIDQGTALHHAHDLEGAIDVCAQAATLARGSADVTSLARAALALQDVSEPRWLEQIDPWLTEALDALPPGDSSLRAQLLATLSLSRVVRERPGGDEASEQAAAIATRVDDVAALLAAYRSRQLALSGPDDTEGRLELSRLMLDLGETRGVDEALVWGHLWRFDALLQLGRVTEAEGEIGELEPIAARTGRPHIRWHLDRCRVAVMVGRGQFGPARRLASETGFIPALAVIAQLTGEPLPAELDRAVTELGHTPPSPIEQLGVIRYLAAMDRMDDVVGQYAEVPLPGHSSLPRYIRLSVYVYRIQIGVTVNDHASVVWGYEHALPYAERHVTSGAGAVVTGGSTELALGQAAAYLGRIDDAIRHLRAGLTANEAAGLWTYVAEACCSLGEVLVEQRLPNDQREGRALLDRGLELARRLGMQPLATRAQTLIEGLAVRDIAVLSEREREIASLVAKGLTNLQIAEAAHISARTAENHVQHILTKLGFQNRSQIAVWATQLGSR